MFVTNNSTMKGFVYYLWISPKPHKKGSGCTRSTYYCLSEENKLIAVDEVFHTHENSDNKGPIEYGIQEWPSMMVTEANEKNAE